MQIKDFGTKLKQATVLPLILLLNNAQVEEHESFIVNPTREAVVEMSQAHNQLANYSSKVAPKATTRKTNNDDFLNILLASIICSCAATTRLLSEKRDLIHNLIFKGDLDPDNPYATPKAV